MSDEFGNHFITCPKCGHEENPSTAIKCEICGNRLKKKSVDPIAYLGVGLALMAALAGGYFAFKGKLNLGVSNQGQSNPVGTADRQATGTIQVLGDTFSGYSTLRNPEFQGLLKQSGITLKYSDEFDQSKRAEALNQGKADLIVTTLDQFLTRKPQGKVIALIDRTIGADAVVLNTHRYPQLKSLIDLNKLVAQKKTQGERLKLAFAEDTPSEFLAMVLSTRFDGFKLTDFEVVRVKDASEAWKQMQDPNSNIALAVLWEPFATQAKKQGNTVVLSSADVPAMIIDVAVASDQILKANPQMIQDFVSSYYSRIDSSVQDKNLLLSQIAADGNLNNIEASNVVQGIHFFTSVEAKKWMESNIFEERIKAIAAILTLSGRIQAIPPAPQELFTAQFTQSPAQKTADLIKLLAKDNPKLAEEFEGRSSDEMSKSTTKPLKTAAEIGDLKIPEIKFATGSAELTTEGKQTLDKLVGEIKEFNPSSVGLKIQGHTSQTGSSEINQKLSQDRATVVVNYFKAKKLPHAMSAEGFGFSQLLPGIDPTSPLNQRTVIRLVRVDT